MSNQLGTFLSLTTFGESHGAAYGGIITNFPAGMKVDFEAVQKQLNRRKPGQSKIVTQRKESDKVKFLSGIFENTTTGTPIGFIIENENQRSRDYSHIAEKYRPSHADFTYDKKYGIRDYRGGGKSSARETMNWVVAGALAQQLIPEIKIQAYVSAVGDLVCENSYQEMDLSKIDETIIRCPDLDMAEKMIERIREIRKEGNTIGGIITCVIKNVPVGWGEPIFHKLHAELGHAMLNINACKGFDYGSGFEGTKMLGKDHNDIFNPDGSTKTNYSGGIQGGISNGMDIYFRVAFKPVATILRPQESIDKKGNPITVEGKGRHDPCVLPRAVPVVESLAAFVLADMMLLNLTRKI